MSTVAGSNMARPFRSETSSNLTMQVYQGQLGATTSSTTRWRTDISLWMLIGGLSEIYGTSPYNYGIRTATPILPADVKTLEPITGLHRPAWCTAPGLIDESRLNKEGDLKDLEDKTRSPPIPLYKEDPRLHKGSSSSDCSLHRRHVLKPI